MRPELGPQPKRNLEQDENFENLVSFIVEKEKFTSTMIKGVIELEKRAHAKGSEYKLKVLNEALRRVTLRELPDLQRRMQEESEKRMGK